MKVTSLIVALIAAGTLTAMGQEGTAENIKQGAKKAGQKIKEGVETVGEKTKDAAETVGEKTKETAETVGKKTKEAVTGKTSEGSTTHHKSRNAVRKSKTQTTEEHSANGETGTSSPAQSPGGR